MTKRKRNQGLAWGALIGLLGLAGIKGVFGGQGLIKGIGNSGNHFHFDPTTHKLPDLIATNETIPAITDEQLAETFQAVLARALEGDLEAATIVFKAAEIQRRHDQIG